MVTVKAEASLSSTNSNGMLMLARTHKSARQLCSDDPRPGDVHTVLLRPRHYRAGAPIWCLCVRDDALALLTSRRCPADEDNGYGDEKEEGDLILTKTDDEVLETELSAEGPTGRMRLKYGARYGAEMIMTRVQVMVAELSRRNWLEDTSS
jgi:hypothetical protein